MQLNTQNTGIQNHRNQGSENNGLIHLSGLEFHFSFKIHSTVGITYLFTIPLIKVAKKSAKTPNISPILDYLEFHPFHSRIIIVGGGWVRSGRIGFLLTLPWLDEVAVSSEALPGLW